MAATRSPQEVFDHHAQALGAEDLDEIVAETATGARRVLTPSDLALEAYQQARKPKRLVLLPDAHFDAHVKAFDAASGAARDWFLEHLGRSG